MCIKIGMLIWVVSNSSCLKSVFFEPKKSVFVTHLDSVAYVWNLDRMNTTTTISGVYLNAHWISFQYVTKLALNWSLVWASIIKFWRVLSHSCHTRKNIKYKNAYSLILVKVGLKSNKNINFLKNKKLKLS